MIGKKKRSIVSIMVTLVFVMSLVLAGCSKKTETSGETPAASTVTETAKAADATAAPTEAPTAAPAEKVKMGMWVQKFEDYNAAWYQRMVDKFNASHPNIEVELSVVPYDAWAQKMKSAQAAGNAPEIYQNNFSSLPTAASHGEILPLDEYMDPKVWDDLYDNVEGFVTVNGKHYGYPMLVETPTVLMYRKDMFTAAGLDPEKPPTTWAELLADAKKLTKNGVYGINLAQGAVEYGWSTWGLQTMFGHRAISDDWSKATVTDYLPLVKFFKDFWDAKVMPPVAFQGGYADNTALEEGKVAMASIGSWAIGVIRNNYPDVESKIGVAKMPSIDGDPNKPTSVLGGFELEIDGKAKHPKEAAEVISWIMAEDPNNMLDFFQTAKYSKFTPRKSVDALISQDPAAANDAWRKLISEKVIPVALGGEAMYPWDVSIAFGNAIERTVLKGQDAAESLKQAEKEINDFIAKSKLAGTNPNPAMK